jgi:hypothetical protein
MGTRLAAFVAYPSKPFEIGSTIQRAVRELKPDRSAPLLETWEQNDIAGRFLATPILSKIDGGDVLIADITALNFNVVFEIGYAIGRRKRAFLVRNRSLVGSDELIREIGIFDTLGYREYENSSELAAVLRSISDAEPLPLPNAVNTASPVYLVLPRAKTDVEVRLTSRIKKARLMFRTFDPDELGRLPAGEAIDNVARSHGVVVPLLAKHRTGAQVHNFRAAFVAGLTLSMERELLLLQDGQDPIPLDYRDLVKSYRSMEQIDVHVADFAAEIGARFQRGAAPVVSEPKTFLERLNLGASAAENELPELGFYYLETDEYRRALRGEVRVVTGRKGAGKTALFAQLRNRLRKDKSRIVLDLRPEGFQLVKFKERVLDYLEEGTKEHTITAFWEYLLFLEIGHRMLDKDRLTHMRDENLFEAYHRLSDAYFAEDFLSEGDFSERLVKLTERIADDFSRVHGGARGETSLSRAQITELLYRHDVAELRDAVVAYLKHKDDLWILFDNLDKGWAAHGIAPEDVLTLRSLIEAMAKLERELSKRDIDCHGIVFIRNDVYEHLVSNSADRGKTAAINLDWTDPDQLREILRKRFIYSEEISASLTFEELWRQIAVTHVNGEESSEYLIERSLMRPRAIIELLQFCRSHAVNLGHVKIESTDIEKGEHHYSNQILSNIGYEVADVFPSAKDILWEFFGSADEFSGDTVRETLRKGAGKDKWEEVFNLLLWYGFLGIIRGDQNTAYIYTVEYEMKRLHALIRKNGMEATHFRINPAFWKALEIQPR